MEHRKYIIFDLDGTLIDSFATAVNACRLVFAEHASTVMPEADYFMAYQHEDFEKMLYELAKLSGMTESRFRYEYDRQYSMDYLTGSKVNPTQYEVLKSAKSKNIGVIVVTNKRQELAEKVCNTLLGHGMVDIVVGRYDTTPIKPTQVVADRLSAHNITSQQCLKYYGDSIADRQQAALLNIKYISIK